MNDNTSSNNTAVCPLTEIMFVLNYQVIPAISGLGILANAYCVIVFIRIIYNERPNNHLFKFFLVKAIHDDILFIIQASCSTCLRYSSQVWLVYFSTYVESVNELCSVFLQIFAAFDCFITLRNKWPFFKKNFYFYLVNIVLLAYSFSYYIFYIFELTIVKLPIPNQTINSTESLTLGLVYYYTDFTYSSLGQGLRLWHSLSNDVIPMFILILLNILISITLKQSVKNKLKIHQTANQQAFNNVQPSLTPKTNQNSANGMSQARKAERNFTLIIVISNINFFIGHFPVFVQAVVLYDQMSVFKSCWSCLTKPLIYLSYASPFFIYVSINKMFRTYAKIKFSRFSS